MVLNIDTQFKNWSAMEEDADKCSIDGSNTRNALKSASYSSSVHMSAAFERKYVFNHYTMTISTFPESILSQR